MSVASRVPAEVLSVVFRCLGDAWNVEGVSRMWRQTMLSSAEVSFRGGSPERFERQLWTVIGADLKPVFEWSPACCAVPRDSGSGRALQCAVASLPYARYAAFKNNACSPDSLGFSLHAVLSVPSSNFPHLLYLRVDLADCTTPLRLAFRAENLRVFVLENARVEHFNVHFPSLQRLTMNRIQVIKSFWGGR